MNTILTVTQINTYIKSVIDYDDNLNNIYVCGEISNFTNHYRTGHLYFTLKDENCSIKAVMFRQYAQALRFEPYNGLKVLLRAKISVYERDGVYQLYVTDMQPDGLGELNLAFEQLKERLSDEGLFDDEFKKSIPKMPSKIAVITSPTGAALQDIINVIKRRYSCCELILVPVQVQGDASAGQLVQAIEYVNFTECAEVIIIARGGGSIEELWSFNEEIVARAIFKSTIPIISGVGHETDYTIADFVSDMRAPTPSAAAELATPDINNIASEVLYYTNVIVKYINEKLTSYELRLDELSEMIDFYSPGAMLQKKKENLADFEKKLTEGINTLIDRKKATVGYYAMSLDALSPLKTLARGYAIVFGEGNKQLSTIKDIKTGDNLCIKIKDGSFNCCVNEVTNEN